MRVLYPSFRHFAVQYKMKQNECIDHFLCGGASTWRIDGLEIVIPNKVNEKLCKTTKQFGTYQWFQHLQPASKTNLQYQERIIIKILFCFRESFPPFPHQNNNLCGFTHSWQQQNCHVTGTDHGAVCPNAAVKAMVRHLTEKRQGSLPFFTPGGSWDLFSVFIKRRAQDPTWGCSSSF